MHLPAFQKWPRPEDGSRLFGPSAARKAQDSWTNFYPARYRVCRPRKAEFASPESYTIFNFQRTAKTIGARAAAARAAYPKHERKTLLFNVAQRGAREILWYMEWLAHRALNVPDQESRDRG